MTVYNCRLYDSISRVPKIIKKKISILVKLNLVQKPDSSGKKVREQQWSGASLFNAGPVLIP